MGTKIKLLGRPIVLRLALVDNDPDQPRQVFPEEEAKELEESIKKGGIHNPNIYVRVHPKIKGRYMLVAGERRFRALRNIGVEEFEFRLVSNEDSPYKISIIENKCRLDLNPIDEAEGYEKWMESDGLTVAEIAAEIPENPQNIYRSMRLLKLPEEVKKLIRQGKLRSGAAHHLLQYKKLGISKQIELAQRLIAGEDPPEIDEQLTSRNERGEAMIEARLPKTTDGLIRRMLKFRQNSNSITFVIEAFLAKPKADQINGWRFFTKDTRDNFTNQIRELIVDLQALLQQMGTLPETRRIPSGIAAVSQKEAAERAKGVSAADANPTAEKPADLKIPSFGVRVTGKKKHAIPPSPIAAPKSVAPQKESPVVVRSKYDPVVSRRVSMREYEAARRHVPPSQPSVTVPVVVHTAAKGNGGEEGKPSRIVRIFNPSYVGTARKVVFFVLTQIRDGKRNLVGKEALAHVLGDGLSAKDIDTPVLESLRTIRSCWELPPDPGNPSFNELIEFLHKLKLELKSRGCPDFEGFIKMVKNRDNSPDPVRLENL